MAKIRLVNLTKKFDRTNVVHDINLLVKEKEFLVLVGPSGCGKTTTLRMIAGLEKPSSGEIYIGDRNVTNLPPKDRDIAMVFQNYALYPHMKVHSNMAFALKLRKFPKKEIERRVQDTARILGIEELLDRKPSEISGGQRQRVAMGRAIIRNPEVFLFDEPLSNLDAKLRSQMRVELAKLHERLGITTVYVTHDQIEAMTLAHRIVIMYDGRIMQIGTPQEVYNYPQNLFVAGFIGSPAMNFIEGRVVQEQASSFVQSKDFKFPIPEDRVDRYSMAKDCDVILGIRPENIYCAKDKFPSQGHKTFEADVEVVELQGADQLLLLNWKSISLNVRVDGEVNIKPHEVSQFYVDMNKMHLFNKDSGEAY